MDVNRESKYVKRVVMRVSRTQSLSEPGLLVKRFNVLRGCLKYVKSCEEGVKSCEEGVKSCQEGGMRVTVSRTCLGRCQELSRECQVGAKHMSRRCQEVAKRASRKSTV